MVPGSRPRRMLGLALLAPVLSGCVSSPKAEAARQQEIQELGDAINQLRNETADLANTVDSLRVAIARHDTTIARMANVTGVVVVK
jgi:outer membrane murein-binding lipoprotein Lpp